MNTEVNYSGSGYQLTAAVLIYTESDTRHAFATKHAVEDIMGQPCIRPGTPFTEGDYKTLVTVMDPASRPGVQWHDTRVLAEGLGRTIWWSPPQTRSLFFQKSHHNAKTFDGKGACPCPGLVFMAVDRKELRVFAFKGRNTPTRETALFQAPFFNVWSGGTVCSGSAVAPGADRAGDLDAWERMFFGSYFTHPNFTEKNRLTVGIDPTRFWAQHINKPSATFPERVLFDLKLKVEDLLDPDLSGLRAIPKAQGEF